jgi:hypothetical protein
VITSPVTSKINQQKPLQQDQSVPESVNTNDNNIKRNKKVKTQRMNEAEARAIISTLSTRGDPLEKYELKNKLGSG